MQGEKCLKGLCINLRKVSLSVACNNNLSVIPICLQSIWFSLTKTCEDKNSFCYDFIGGTIQHLLFMNMGHVI